jgi:phosphoglycerol transferase MdoB-like AlkP superfamily enzyme
MKVRAAFAIFVYIVAANIPFWMASHSIGLLLTGWFNVEFAMIGILSFFIRRTLTIWLLLGAMLLDMLRGIGATYMLSPLEMLRSARYVSESAPSHLWGIAVVTICIAVVCVMASLALDSRIDGRVRGYGASALAIFVIACGTVDVSTGHTTLFGQDRQLNTSRLTRVPTHALVMSELQRQGYSRTHPIGVNVSVPSASKMLARFETASSSSGTKDMLPNVVVIVVESWGKPLATDLEESLVRPYSGQGLLERYTLSQGTVPFYGPTIAGEARELCGSAMGFGLLTASVPELKRCLPETMNAMGYHSTAVHGYSARMFDRVDWYGRIGFDETWFRDQLQRQGLPMCPGPFPGTCDAATSVWIGDQLEKNSDSPQFIYWVTLNSHLPVPIPNLVKDPPSCSDRSITAENEAICSWYQLVFNVHRSVSELALRATMRPTIFLIVGDHAPPFSSARLRSQFSDRVVPYLLLVPKTDGTAESPGTTRSLAVVARPAAGARRAHLKKELKLSSSVVGG